MKYIVIEEYKNDVFIHGYDSKDEAIKYADYIWSRTCDSDKKRMVAFYVLESENPDEDAVNHLDGNPVKIYK